jgi:CheY-like chemotaxis protein
MSFRASAIGGSPPDVAEVLVADDNPTNVFILTTMLKSFGVSVLSAADGVQAVQIATLKLPALILMDVQMPRMDGITAARRIRGAMLDRRAAIVAVTAFPEARLGPDLEAAEFDDFLFKPIELSVVHRLVEKWLHGTRESGSRAQR